MPRVGHELDVVQRPLEAGFVLIGQPMIGGLTKGQVSGPQMRDSRFSPFLGDVLAQRRPVADGPSRHHQNRCDHQTDRLCTHALSSVGAAGRNHFTGDDGSVVHAPTIHGLDWRNTLDAVARP